MEPQLVQQGQILALGAGAETSDATIMSDSVQIGKRMAQVRAKIGDLAIRPRLFVAASMNYEKAAGTYRYAMGDAVTSFNNAAPGLERISVPAGLYAAFTVRPILGFLWGPAIGKAYAFIYGKWLPRSAYQHDPRPTETYPDLTGPTGKVLEHFEYHDERAARKRGAEIEIRVPVRLKA
jgi:predicted transcriptional regulator YdeE